MPKQTVTKKPVAPKRNSKPRAKAKPAPKPVVVVDIETEFPYDGFPWKLTYKDRTEKRTCYFQCEEHRKKHITRYKLSKKDILFIGYKFDE